MAYVVREEHLSGNEKAHEAILSFKNNESFMRGTNKRTSMYSDITIGSFISSFDELMGDEVMLQRGIYDENLSSGEFIRLFSRYRDDDSIRLELEIDNLYDRLNGMHYQNIDLSLDSDDNIRAQNYSNKGIYSRRPDKQTKIILANDISSRLPNIFVNKIDDSVLKDLYEEIIDNLKEKGFSIARYST